MNEQRYKEFLAEASGNNEASARAFERDWLDGASVPRLESVRLKSDGV